nr:harbinger transposase-derived protein [Tanacetum cinerariifolium]
MLIHASTSIIRKTPRKPIDRDRYNAHDRVVAAYFVKNSMYAKKTLRKRFRMSRTLFTRIIWELTLYIQQGEQPRRRYMSIAYSQRLKDGNAQKVSFVAKSVIYKWGYCLANGIYSDWAILVTSISQLDSNDTKRIRYKNVHEATRKDVE